MVYLIKPAGTLRHHLCFYMFVHACVQVCDPFNPVISDVRSCNRFPLNHMEMQLL